jgi:hypothetical protein
MFQSRLFGGVVGTSVLGAKLKQSRDGADEKENVPRRKFLNQMQKSQQLRKSESASGSCSSVSSTLSTGSRLLSAMVSRKVAQCQEAAAARESEQNNEQCGNENPDTSDEGDDSNNPHGNQNRFRNPSQVSGASEENEEKKKKKKKKKVVAAAIEDAPDSDGGSGNGSAFLDLSGPPPTQGVTRSKSIKVSHPSKVDESAPSRDIETIEPVR